MKEHDDVFKNLISEFRKGLLFSYFDMNKPFFVFVDAHHTVLGDMLTQGQYIQWTYSYFVMNKVSFLFADAHQTGLGAMLVQGQDKESAQPYCSYIKDNQCYRKMTPKNWLGSSWDIFCITKI